MLAGHDMPYGATLEDDGATTRFRLWAPDISSVRLAIAGSGVVPMDQIGDGWHERAMPAGAGTRYRFVLPDGMAVPDPASRAQHEGDVHGWSVVVDPGSYHWQHPDWAGRPWHETVLCEIHVGVMGGFAGVAAELPRLARMGITAVELMPVAEFPGERNWGYDGVLPYAPAAAYGRPDELKQLIDQAHGLGLMVFLDVVYNHFGPDGAYLHAYARPFFDTSAHTPWGAAIDVGVPAVGDYFAHNALYWLNEYRFDGLRFDAVHSINNDPWLRTLGPRIRAGVPADRHVHLVLENEANQAAFLADGVFDAQWNDDFHNSAHVLLTGETDGYYAWYANDPRKWKGRGVVNRASTFRPCVSSTSCRITTRWATVPMANGSHAWLIPKRSPLPRHYCCCRPSCRCCSWARSEAAAPRSCSSPTTRPRNCASPCAKAAGGNSPASRNTAITYRYLIPMSARHSTTACSTMATGHGKAASPGFSGCATNGWCRTSPRRPRSAPRRWATAHWWRAGPWACATW
jgi:hypothetical protein